MGSAIETILDCIIESAPKEQFEVFEPVVEMAFTIEP